MISAQRPAELLADLQATRRQLDEAIAQLPVADCYRQYHAELSPLAWHLGHCVYTELHWLRAAIGRTGRVDDCLDDRLDDDLKALYTPALSRKAARAAALPSYDALLDWAGRQQAECHARLEQLPWRHCPDDKDNALLHDCYLLRFLAQHYAQHIETAHLILAQRALQLADAAAPAGHVADNLSGPLAAAEVQRSGLLVQGGRHAIGSPADDKRDAFHYDNEAPAFAARLTAFSIAEQPVNHAEYLGFVAAGGYEDEALWSAAGWRWRVQNEIHAPMHWRRGGGHDWYAVRLFPKEQLDGDTPLFGINHYEASAFARWAGARLPHEYEWEAAARSGRLAAVGCVWEWCANRFHPYAGFRAFPYAGYSLPWFDGTHYVLRGGSRHSLGCIRRPSFRNYYPAPQRHIQAGLRLCFE